MGQQPQTPGEPAAPRTEASFRLGRWVVIAFVSILPAVIGMVHLFAYPLIPYAPTIQPVTARSSEAMANLALAQTRHRIDTTFDVVFIAGVAACLVIGLLGARRALAWAFMQACIAGIASLISDGQGAFMAPVVLTFVAFWPLIKLGNLVFLFFLRWSMGRAEIRRVPGS